MIWIIIAVLVTLTILIKKPKLLIGEINDGNKIGLSPKLIYISIGLLIFNGVVWAMIPWFWNVLFQTWYTLIFFNVGSWSVLYLRTIKEKDGAGKETDKNNPTAEKVATLIAIVVLVGLLTTSYFVLRRGDLNEEEYKKEIATEKERQKIFIREPVLALVAKCKPNEFNSLEKVQKAERLYAEKGLLPWHNSMDCWESMITKDILPIKLAVVDTPTEDWSQKIISPKIRGGAIVDWPNAPKGCEVMPNGEESKKLPCQKAVYNFPLYFIQFHSNGDKPLKVEVVVRQ